MPTAPNLSESDARLGPFPVYVPHAGVLELADVLRGSALVGFATESDPRIVHVHYEGNLYDTPELVRFADRVKHAASRCRWQRFDVEVWRREHGGEPPPPTEHGFITYPTSAQAFVPLDTLMHVAEYDDFLGVVEPIGIHEGVLLTEWIGSHDASELIATGRVFELRRGESPPA